MCGICIDEGSVCSSHSIYSTFGMVKRPQPARQEDAPFRSAGGSSGGSAAAVAAELCDGYLYNHPPSPTYLDYVREMGVNILLKLQSPRDRYWWLCAPPRGILWDIRIKTVIWDDFPVGSGCVLEFIGYGGGAGEG